MDESKAQELQPNAAGTLLWVRLRLARAAASGGGERDRHWWRRVPWRAGRPAASPGGRRLQRSQQISPSAAPTGTRSSEPGGLRPATASKAAHHRRPVRCMALPGLRPAHPPPRSRKRRRRLRAAVTVRPDHNTGLKGRLDVQYVLTQSAGCRQVGTGSADGCRRASRLRPAPLPPSSYDQFDCSDE